MLSNHDMKQTLSKFDEILSKRPNNRLINDSLTVIRKISESKFPVYLVDSNVTNQHYAMKIFPHFNGQPEETFENEARFAFLKHPNVVNFVHSEKGKQTVFQGKVQKISYVLTEYASHGDFFDFTFRHKNEIDEKLARTYFRQLIDGIEYLHAQGVAHLDIKPENLLLGNDFTLKIDDFDFSYLQGDKKILSRGTENYRGPEFFRAKAAISPSKGIFAEDIYSAGVILFLMKSGGIYPHTEDDGQDYGNLVNLMYKDNNRFWERHCEIKGKPSSFYDRNFKELFNKMVKEKPADRWTIKQIKQSKWYNGPVYSSVELQAKMKEILGS